MMRQGTCQTFSWGQQTARTHVDTQYAHDVLSEACFNIPCFNIPCLFLMIFIKRSRGRSRNWSTSSFSAGFVHSSRASSWHYHQQEVQQPHVAVSS